MLVPSLLSALFPLLAALVPGALWLLERWLDYLALLGRVGEAVLALVPGSLPLPLVAGPLFTWVGALLWDHRPRRPRS